MKIWANIQRISTKSIRGLLPLFCIGLLGVSIVFANRRPAPLRLESLDPAFMKAVTASISQHDVSAILKHQRSSASVHVQLYTSCDEERRCTIFTSMDFPRSEAHASGISLHVTTHVIRNAENAQGTTMSSWRVEANGPTIDKRVTYAGNFNDLKRVPRIGESNAIGSLLTSIRSGIETVLAAEGVIAKPNTAGV